MRKLYTSIKNYFHDWDGTEMALFYAICVLTFVGIGGSVYSILTKEDKEMQEENPTIMCEIDREIYEYEINITPHPLMNNGSNK